MGRGEGGGLTFGGEGIKIWWGNSTGGGGFFQVGGRGGIFPGGGEGGCEFLAGEAGIPLHPPSRENHGDSCHFHK